jgi:hypothetical protein
MELSNLGTNSWTAAKVGPNALQNFPVIQSAVAFGPFTFVTISLNSIPKTSFVVQIFANAAPDPSGFGQGKTLVATVTITTDAMGNGVVVVNVPMNLKGLYLAATATDPLGDTSEFGKDVKVM